MSKPKKRLLIVGWDGADWKVASPLMDGGKMPHLKRFVDEGVMGNLSTLNPVLSPMLWTSIATGKRAYKHGIHGFIEPDASSGGVRPITNLGRKCKAIWNILNQNGYRSNVVGWWPSHPAEPINGVMVSNHFQKSVEDINKPWPVRRGAVYPAELTRQLRKFRVHSTEIDGSQLLPFVPNAADVDQEKDKRLTGIAKIVAEMSSVQAVATALMQHEPWDFMAVYFDALDHFCHGFMKFHPPREDWVNEKDFEMYKDVINTAYQFQDLMLGAMLELAGDDTTVILVSDHGFHPDHLRPQMIGNEPAGPADEHRQFGVFAMKGPGIKKDSLVFGASLLDVTPTVLACLGLPVGRDMDGRPLVDAFETDPGITEIDSWDEVPGDDGSHPADVQADPVDAHASLQQLVDLGYIDEPDEDADKAAASCVRELRYNLARDYFDARKLPEAIVEFTALWNECPDESRFGVKLFNCWLSLGNADNAEVVLDQLIEQKRLYAQQALDELKMIKQARDDKPKPDPDKPRTKTELEEEQQEFQKVRKLTRRARTNPAAFAYFRGCLLHVRGDYEQALEFLHKAEDVQVYNQPSLRRKMGECHLALEQWDEAAAQYQHILAIDPISADGQLGIAQCELGLKHPRKAYRAALSALGLVYYNPKANYVAARALCQLGQERKAVTHLHTALEQNPVFPDCHRLLAKIYHAWSDIDAATRHEEFARTATQRVDDFKHGRVLPEDTSLELDIAMDSAIGIGSFNGGAINGSTGTSPMIVVSGLPRTGTSMMMQMLAAGGIETLVDDHRPADESNALGYYEFAPAKKLARKKDWLTGAQGKAVKIVAQLLPDLPPDHPGRIIFMARPLGEIVTSQSRMLERLGRTGASVSDRNLAATFKKQVERVSTVLTHRESLAAITVEYADAIADPRQVAKRVNAFLGGKLNEAAMAAVVDPSMYHERR